VNFTFFPRQFAILLSLAALAGTAQAQTYPSAAPATGSRFLGGVPSGAAAAASITLTVGDAIFRSLDHNLGVLSTVYDVDRARATRRIALSALLPNLSAGIAEARQVRNLEVFGFPLRGEFPSIVGPFNTFDARLYASQSVFNLSAMRQNRAEGHRVEAARFENRSAREVVILVTAKLYLDALAANARADAARAQLETSQALQAQALDLRQGGIIAGIDVVRSEVRLGTDRQRATAAENEFQKAKLQLARAIGLPLGQAFTLSMAVPELPAPQLTVDEAVERAYQMRPDYLAALERVRAAEIRRDGIAAERLPSVAVSGDWGAIGLTPATARSTFTVTGAINVPIFQGGRQQGRLLEAETELAARRAEAEDLHAAVYYDVHSALLDLQAINEQLQVASRGRQLASQQLTQSRDRFAAGVASSLEVVEAQEAVAEAEEQYIRALYGSRLATGVLVESLGTAEEAVEKYLGGSNR
jgi:outer membrane protein TolC